MSKKTVFIVISLLLAVTFSFVACKKDPVSVTGVSLNKASTAIDKGQTEKLVATVAPADAANKKVTWTSSDATVAKVSEDGTVTAVKKGTAKITVTTEDGGFSASCEVTVNGVEQKMPLTLEFPTAGTVTIDKTGEAGTVYYSLDGGKTITEATSEPISVPDKGKICLYRDLDHDLGFFNYFQIKCSADCYVYGNVMSLISKTDFATANTVFVYAFYNLFKDNTHIQNHPSWDLVLPATTLADHCYSQMFYGCSSLETAPELSATTLASYCYGTMFDNCTKLEAAPVLSAGTLVQGCYSMMFYGCTKLNSITCLATDISAEDCTLYWVSGIAAKGTFITPTSTAWSDNSSGIPSGWTRTAP